MVYANILAHELFYRKILGRYDDPFASTNTPLSSPIASSRVPLVLTPAEAKAIAKAMDATFTPPVAK